LADSSFRRIIDEGPAASNERGGLLLCERSGPRGPREARGEGASIRTSGFSAHHRGTAAAKCSGSDAETAFGHFANRFRDWGSVKEEKWLCHAPIAFSRTS